MSPIDIVPGRSVDGIPFGTIRADVRRLCGPSFEEYRVSRSAAASFDDYGAYHVLYDADGRLEAFEFTADVDVLVDGLKVFPVALERVEEVVPDLIEDKEIGGYTSLSMSLGLTYVDGSAESLLVGREGYYEQPRRAGE